MSDFYVLLIQFMLFIFACFFSGIVLLAIFTLSNNLISFRKKTNLSSSQISIKEEL